jgi:hypothetical protein
MTTPPADLPAVGIPSGGARAAELLAIPVSTDQDVLNRVGTLISPAARRYRTLWLFFFDQDGTQANLVVPIDDIPERPAASVLANLCYVAAESIAGTHPGGTVVITLSRPGALKLTADDRHVLRSLQHGAAVHATPVRMLCLATPQGVRELGPVMPSR